MNRDRGVGVRICATRMTITARVSGSMCDIHRTVMLAKTITRSCVVFGVTLLAAHADAEPETEPAFEAPPAVAAAAGAAGADQVTLPKGWLLLDAFAEINLSSGAVFQPFSISPDLWYGVTDDVTVGLVHSAAGRSGFIGGVGDALCLTGEDNGCPDVYPGFGFDARYRLETGALVWAAEGGLYVRHLADPFQLAIKLGAVGRWQSGGLAIELAPNLFIGLTNRTPTVTVGAPAVAPNREVLDLPVTALYSVTPAITAAVQLGIALPLEDTGDAYAIPLSLGGHYRVDDRLDLTLAFSLPRLFGGGPQTGFDARSLTLGGTYAF